MPVTVAEYKRAVEMFFRRVEAKASWGKVELKQVWSECFVAVVADEYGEG